MEEFSLVKDKLVTQEQLADMYHVSIGTVSKWLKDKEILPYIPANRTTGESALYSLSLVTLNFPEIKDVINRQVAPVLANEEATAVVAANIIQRMREDKSETGTVAILNNAMGFMEMMKERIGELQSENVQLKQEKHYLEMDIEGWQGYAGLLKEERDSGLTPKQQKLELEQYMEEQMKGWRDALK
jgi:transcriptional regulator with XRE-family HTH domain